MSELSFLELPEFDNHVRVVPLNDPGVQLRGYIAIHRSRGGYPSLGATRVWSYSSDEEALRDALRLSRLMSYKSALAGLPYGGAKSALILPPDGITDRDAFFTAYAKQVEALGGKFVTGTDVGVSNEDLVIMSRATSYVIGHGVNSGYFTSIAVYQCILMVLAKLFNKDIDISKKSFAIQGLGKTGFELLSLLVRGGAREIYVADLNKVVQEAAKKKFPFIRIVPPETILAQKVQVLCPCALGGVLNEETIPTLNCQAVIGPANNQLATPFIGKLLYERGIFYAPDYLVNAGGLISVVDQYRFGKPDPARIERELVAIPKNLGKIFDLSQVECKPTSTVADELAEAILNPTS